MPEVRPARPLTVDPSTRTARAVLSNGARVRRNGIRPDGSFGPWVEGLSIEGADLSRATGAPLLVDHIASAENQLGVVETAAREGDKIVASIRFGKGPRADRYFTDVQDGIRAGLSIGYNVLSWVKEKAGEVPVFIASSWQLLEASIVALPADASAGFRSNPEGLRTMTLESSPVPEGTPATVANNGLDERQRAVEVAALCATAGVPELAGMYIARSEPVDALRGEIGNIPAIFRLAGPEGAPAVRGMLTRGIAVEAVRTAVTDLRASQQQASMTRNLQVRGGTDASEARGRGLANAVAHRLSGGAVALGDEGAAFRGFGLADIARECLELQGHSTRGMSAGQTVDQALQVSSTRMGGLHTTSDFATLLAQGGHRTLLARFEQLRSVLVQIARRTQVPDFRPIRRLQIGTAPALNLINEHGEYERGTMGDHAETYRVRLYGRMFGLTRELIVNDDLNAFADFLNEMARQAAVTLADVIYAVLSANSGNGVTMTDGTALFHANHANKAVSGAAPSITTLNAARLAMRTQKATDGITPIGVVPKYLLVGPTLETAAEQLLTEIVASTVEGVNPFSQKLTLLVEPRITGNAWYVFAEPGLVPTLEYAELDGSRPMSATGPVLESKPGWDVAGIEYRVTYDCGAGAIAWQGAHLNSGS